MAMPLDAAESKTAIIELRQFHLRNTVHGVGPHVAITGAGAAKNTGHGPVWLNSAHRMVLADLDALLPDQTAQGMAELGVIRRAPRARRSLLPSRRPVPAVDRAAILFRPPDQGSGQ